MGSDWRQVRLVAVTKPDNSASQTLMKLTRWTAASESLASAGRHIPLLFSSPPPNQTSLSLGLHSELRTLWIERQTLLKEILDLKPVSNDRRDFIA
jgi:hypothetical protein